MTNHTENNLIAQKIADNICQQALWLDGRCNWTGVFCHSQIANAEVVLRALPSNFYSGSAGVAFFLSAMFETFPKEIYRNTALGAWHKTIDQLPKIRVEKVGFYEGLGGIAYSLVQSGIWLNSTEIIEAGLQLAETVCQNINKSSFDVMEGCAGGIIAIAAINRLFPRKTFEEAIRLGGIYLLNNCHQTKKGISWKVLPTKGPNLTGYSQGNSGIIHALAEVYALCLESQYLYAIEQAVAYENDYYSIKYQNWKDLRLLHQAQSQTKISKTYLANAWCHGAAGIGLSRCRTFQLTKQDFLLKDTKIVADMLIRKTYEAIEIFSLCHGFIGDLYHLHTLGLYLEREELKVKLKQGLENLNLSLENLQLPDSENHRLQNSTFMQGWSGIAYFLLSLQNQNLPNMLTLGL